jgi:hypothetical protein
MSTLATLEDTVTLASVSFMMNPGWEPTIHEEGMLWYPLGNLYATKSTDGTKGVGGKFTIVCTSDTMEANVITLLTSLNPLLLTLPNGSNYHITIDPATDRKGNKVFSMMENPDVPPINTFEVVYAQVS